MKKLLQGKTVAELTELGIVNEDLREFMTDEDIMSMLNAMSNEEFIDFVGERNGHRKTNAK